MSRPRGDVERVVGLVLWLMLVVPFTAATVMSPWAFARALALSAWDVPRAPVVLARWLLPAYPWFAPAESWLRALSSPQPQSAPSTLSAIPLGHAAATAGAYRVDVAVMPARFARSDEPRVYVSVRNMSGDVAAVPEVIVSSSPVHGGIPPWQHDVTLEGEGQYGLPSGTCANGTECLAPGETARWTDLVHGYELATSPGEYMLRARAGRVVAEARFEVVAQEQEARAAHAAAADAGPWRLTLETARDSYARGEPVAVHVVIENRSAQPQPLSDAMTPRVYVSLTRAGKLLAQWPVDVPAGYVTCAEQPPRDTYPPRPAHEVACLPAGGRVEAAFTWPGSLPIGAQPEPAPRGGNQRAQRMGALDAPPGDGGWEGTPVSPGAYVLAVGVGPTTDVPARSRETMPGAFLTLTQVGYPWVTVMPMPVGGGYWITQPYQVRLPVAVR